jgi:hypothetical protein
MSTDEQEEIFEIDTECNNNNTDKLLLSDIDMKIIDLSKLKGFKSVHLSSCTFDSIIINLELNSIAICDSIISDNFKLPDNLITFIFYNTKYKTDNYVSILDNLPTRLEKLQIEECVETTLDNLPNSLKELYIFETPIISLDYLPAGLEILVCQDNMYLKKLSLLPNNLNKLIYDKFLKNIDEISNNYPNLILEYWEIYPMEFQQNVPNLMENIFGERYYY